MALRTDTPERHGRGGFNTWRHVAAVAPPTWPSALLVLTWRRAACAAWAAWAARAASAAEACPARSKMTSQEPLGGWKLLEG